MNQDVDREFPAAPPVETYMVEQARKRDRANYATAIGRGIGYGLAAIVGLTALGIVGLLCFAVLRRVAHALLG
jgi:hypothetical protein